MRIHKNVKIFNLLIFKRAEGGCLWVEKFCRGKDLSIVDVSQTNLG